ncbi:hypothetical protein [Arthrobacter sp. S39]|uniref:hypothetical protein n=1 Tax=Arthrobacter sp. S39 TaxID=2509720 RepID=UPI001036FC83|nr:hypothetical protein [Arthrobacter sp. S39]TAP43176.1 hypothetical protein EYS21_13545 [Arthrobacter sp. S39]
MPPTTQTETDPTLPTATERKPMKLSLVFLFGFLASLAVIGSLIWFFAAYETGDLWPFGYNPRINQDTWFEVIRNAVTTAAALGVGITLFFSYRRQQTAEQNQRVAEQNQRVAALAQLTAAKAQRTAADALELSNKQHALDQDRRKDAVTAELRTRYAQTAEQLGSSHLPVRLAGVYSLAALADDWADIGNEDERQVCVDLLCAYFRSEQPGEDAAVKRELADATLQVIKERLGTATQDRKFWGSSRIRLHEAGQLPSLAHITLERGGELSIRGASVDRPTYWRHIELNGGLLNVSGLRLEKFSFGIRGARVAGGMFGVSVLESETNSDGNKRVPTILVRNLTLDGGEVRIYAPGCRVTFNDCVFKRGSLTINTMSRAKPGGDRVAFGDCLFETDVLAGPDPKRFGNVGTTPGLTTSTLVVGEDCRFENGASVLVSASIEDQR